MRALIFAAALVAASPALAQERMTQADCEGAWQALEAVMPGEAGTATPSVTDAGWCKIEDAQLPIDSGSLARIDLLEWRASDITRLIEEGLPPRALEMRAEGLRIAPQTGDPVYDYLLELQSSVDRAGFGLSARWDGVQNVVLIEEAWLDLYGDNRIEGTARIEGVDLTDWAAIQSSAGTAGLADLSLKTTFDGWFETYVAVALGSMLLSPVETEPRAQVAALQDEAVAMIDAFPESFMPAPSRTALTAFLRALPAPRGSLQLQLSAAPALGAVRMVPLSLLPAEVGLAEAMEAALEGVTLLVTWAPEKAQ